MACCTYLSDSDCKALVSDAELNSLLEEVRAATGDDWRIRETVYEIPSWFRASRWESDYELLHHTFGPEFQLINLYRPDREKAAMSSINLRNDASHVAAYLYGVLAGAQVRKHA